MEFPIINTDDVDPLNKRWFLYPPADQNKICSCCDGSDSKGHISIILGEFTGSGSQMTIYSDFDQSTQNNRVTKIIDCAKTERIEIYFCSIECLRKFFNNICDKVEMNAFPDKWRDKQINNIIN